VVRPSVVEVNHHHQVSVGNHVNGWTSVLGTLIIELEGVEEGIDDSLLSPGELSSDFLLISREDDTEGSSEEAILGLLWVMDGVHLEVVSLLINGVLRSSVEMELLSNELGVSFEDLSGELRDEVVWIGSIRNNKINLDGVTVHVNWSRESIRVFLHVSLLVFSSIILPGVLLSFVGLVIEATLGFLGHQVDWRLVGSAAVVGSITIC